MEMTEGEGKRGAGAAVLLGKRQRPPIRRTTSVTKFSLEDLTAAAELADPGWEIGHHNKFEHRDRRRASAADRSPTIVHRRSFGDLVTLSSTAPFLMSCGLCNRGLGPGCDTFIYRGEVAFCSLECRQHKINQDERLTANKTDAAAPTTAAKTSGNGQTVVAA